MKYTDRTCKIIDRGRRILIKKGGLYMGCWTSIAAGPDDTRWVSKPWSAMEFHNLDWAFAIAKLYGAKVVTRR